MQIQTCSLGVLRALGAITIAPSSPSALGAGSGARTGGAGDVLLSTRLCVLLHFFLFCFLVLLLLMELQW